MKSKRCGLYQRLVDDVRVNGVSIPEEVVKKVRSMNQTTTYNFIRADYVAAILRDLPREQVFTVVFEKRTDGKLRKMNCRRDVRKALKGGQSTIASHKELQSVYDMTKRGYRCFDIERVLMIRADGFVLKSADFDENSTVVDGTE